MNRLATAKVIRIAAGTVLGIERVKPKLLCNSLYAKRSASFDGRNCWVTVVGYDNNLWTDFDLICSLTKPTKRQVRKLKRAYR